MKNNDTKTYRPTIFMVICCAVVFTFIELLLSPIYVIISTDIVVSISLLPEAIELLVELADIIAFALCYSIIIYSAVTSGTSKAKKLFFVYTTACLVRRAVSLVVAAFVNTSISMDDVMSVSAILIFEIIQAAVITAIACGISKKHKAQVAEYKKAARQVGDRSDVTYLDIDSVFSRSNPLLRCAFISGVILSAVKIATRVFYDISYTLIYGAPNGISEIITMAIYYLSDVLIFVLFYTFSWFILSKLVKKSSAIKE